jgi:enoyl-CoA hydratase
MADRILNERRGEGTYITINRPEANGVVTDEMAVEIAGMIDAAAKTSKFIVYRSNGADFCTGRDRGNNPRPREALEYREASEAVFGFYDSFRRSPIPVVAAVQGRALGLGCSVAALCDITIASDESRYALPEMGHRTMPTIAMSSLIDRVGRKGVLYLAYTAREIDAQTALAYGIVSLVVPKAELDKEVEAVTAAITKEPMPAVLAAKEFTTAAMSMDARHAVTFAKSMHGTVNTSSRMRE